MLLERGECSFTSKALKAQEAGAAAAIITEQNPDNDDLYISMVDDTTGRDVIIPTAFLLGKNGYVVLCTSVRVCGFYCIIFSGGTGILYTGFGYLQCHGEMGFLRQATQPFFIIFCHI